MTEQSPAHGVRASTYSSVTEVVIDAAGIAGAGLIVYGVSLIYRPAAFIVAGAFLLVGVWLFARKAVY